MANQGHLTTEAPFAESMERAAVEEEELVSPVNTSFARALEVVTWLGLGAMVLFGVLYLFGISSFVGARESVAHWSRPASDFWHDVKGISPDGYGWFLTNLGAMDSLSLVGISILALAPLAAIFSAISKSTQKVFVVLFFVLSLEFIFAIVRPLIMAGGGH